MKRVLALFAISFIGLETFAQAPEDALKYGFFPQKGTARTMAIGGAVGSLGGDITSLYVNPAGLGFYKTSEFVISPGLIFNNNQGTFRGAKTSISKSGFDLGTSGIVLGSATGRNYGARSQAFSFGFTQTANFNNTISYRGLNNYSSLSEQYAEQISNSGQSIDDILNNPYYAYGSAPALYTYLVDTFRNASNVLEVKGLPEFLLDNGMALQQERVVKTGGGIYELALGYGANLDNKWFIGGTIGIPIVSYSRNTYYRESDTSSNTNNNFNYFELRDSYKTSGVGINLKLGVIYQPVSYWRLGFALHTPSFYALKDKQSNTIETDTEGYTSSIGFPVPQPIKVSSSIFTEGYSGNTDYTSNTPLKMIASTTFIFGTNEDVKKQKGFITADVEYINYKGSRFRPTGEFVTQDDEDYYDGLKDVIKSYYKSAFNYRLGGELKFNTIMVRAGGSYYANPYKDSDLKADIFQVSGGLGYRDKGMFIDLAYVHNITKDVDFPYRLADRANTFAQQKNTKGNVMLTVGFKF